LSEKRLDENTTNRMRETIGIHRSSTKLLIDWKHSLMRRCRECLQAKRDKTVPRNTYSNKCDCDVQFFLDEIVELLGNGKIVVNGEEH